MATAERHEPHGLWLDEARPPAPLPPLRGEARADVLVIGGGFTGLWTAWHVLLREPGAQIVLLEGDRCGFGPSGRNGGFVNSLWISLPRLTAAFGRAAALRLCRASSEAVAGIERFCREEAVEASFRRAPHLVVSAAPAQDGAWNEAVTECAEAGVADQYRALAPSEVADRCRSPVFRGGALLADAATVQPARLAVGLRAALLARDVRIFETTRVRALRTEAGGDVVAEADGGARVRAPRAVLAAGPRSAALEPLRRRLTVSSSHMVVTEPVPDVLESVGWTGGEGITDCRALLHYFRTTGDGRIAFGWAGGRMACGARVLGRREVDPDVAAGTHRALLRVFPAVAGRRITHAWGGAIDVSPTHIPWAGTLPGGRVAYGLGYTGNGVGPSHLMGDVLAGMALDRRDAATRLALVEPPAVTVPPEPLRVAGGAFIRRALVRKEEREEAGQAVDVPTRLVCDLPRRMGVHIVR